MLWRAEPITIRRNPQFSKWKYILGPGTMLLLTGLANTLAFSLPMLVIGGKAGLGPAGDLGFAYNLSIQAVMLMRLHNWTTCSSPRWAKWPASRSGSGARWCARRERSRR